MMKIPKPIQINPSTKGINLYDQIEELTVDEKENGPLVAIPHVPSVTEVKPKTKPRSSSTKRAPAPKEPLR